MCEIAAASTGKYQSVPLLEDEQPTVDSDHKRVGNKTNIINPKTQIVQWLGIQYAEYNGRWRRSSALSHTPEIIIDASKAAAIAPQLSSSVVTFEPGVVQDENCLNLNITRPRKTGVESKQQLLPVMVWIHGGAYIYGSANQPIYRPENLAHNQNVLVASLNYRLGALGFLNLTSLNPSYTPNPGLSDIILALEWVKNNIAAFGGDPNKITIFGESAGGAIVTTLLTSPHAKGLFQNAIAQSAPASSINSPHTSAALANAFLRLAQEATTAGSENDNKANGVDAPSGILEELSHEKLSELGEKLLHENSQINPGTLAFAPAIDGDLVPENPVITLADGRGHPVSLIIGTNKHEASLFTHMRSPLVPVSPESSNAMLEALRHENPWMAKELPRQYKGRGGRTRIATDIAFRMPALWIANGHSKNAPTFVYRFDQATPLLRLLNLGAMHAAELGHVWGNGLEKTNTSLYRLGGLPAARILSKKIQSWWGAFAHGEAMHTVPVSGPAASFGWQQQRYTPDAAPGDTVQLSAKTLKPWPCYRPASRLVMILNTHPKIRSEIDQELLKYWGAKPITFT